MTTSGRVSAADIASYYISRANNFTAAAYQLEAETFNDVALDDPRQLGDFMWERYKSQGEPDVTVLDECIQATQNAVDLMQEPSYRARLLFNLGVRYEARFALRTVLSDVDGAISAYQSAVELTPDEDNTLIKRLTHLGSTLRERFDRTGDLDDLDSAIKAFRRAANLIPDGDTRYKQATVLCNYGIALTARFERTHELGDIGSSVSILRRAIDLTPCGHSDEPTRFFSLGNSLIARYEYTGNVSDLEEAVSAHSRAVELAPDDHPDKHSHLNNLGNSLVHLSQHTGHLDELERAVAAHRRAVELTPDEHLDKPTRLNNLGSSLLNRFERTGESEDVIGAVSALRRAVELTANDHHEKPMRLNNLGISLMRRFEKTRDSEDLEASVTSFELALDLALDEYPHKPQIQSNLSKGLLYRFEHTNNIDDIERAISVGHRAMNLLPEGHPDLSVSSHGLANCLQHRSKYTGDKGDLNRAIDFYRQAIEHTPDGHPRLSMLYLNLGSAQQQVFESTKTQADFDVTIESFMTSTMQMTGIPSQRMLSARRCAHLLAVHPAFRTVEAYLAACSRIIEVLPEIVWLGHSIHRRYDERSKLGGLVNECVSAAINPGELSRAVEWLEAGRSLIWSQVLSLRTPLQELQDSHPELAESLRAIQVQLRQSVHSNLTPDSGAFAGIAGISVNTAAEHHRGLAIEYTRLIEKIRSCSGFADFLRSKPLDSTVSSHKSNSNSVVFVNVEPSRCDAVVLSPGGKVTLTPLPALSLKRAKGLLMRWNAYLRERLVRVRGLVSMDEVQESLNPLVIVLECMWTWTVSPILQGLDFINPPSDGEQLPCITWCPTGPLTKLPLHAAGMYSNPDGPRAFNLVVSSYTPSLSALLRSCKGVVAHRPVPKMFVLTQPDTPLHSPLPGTRAEGRELRDLCMRSGITTELLEHDRATVGSVRSIIDQYPWVHFACHALQHPSDATQSAFSLYDGPLSLLDLMSTVAKDAELAFLSACQTATGDEKNPEEAVHLAAGMLAVGFKGVVATLWSIGDDDAPIVVDVYYRKLLELRSSGTLKEGQTGAAYALHEAVKVLRERVGESKFMKWAPFVHFGI